MFSCCCGFSTICFCVWNIDSFTQTGKFFHQFNFICPPEDFAQSNMSSKPNNTKEELIEEVIYAQIVSAGDDNFVTLNLKFTLFETRH